MKKLLLLTGLYLVGITAYAQSGQKWATGGNSNGSGDFLGTTNSQPIVFKTNNQLRATLGANGVFQVNNLSGAGTRLVLVDANGNLSSLPQGSASQVLYGNGTWGNLPQAPAMQWSLSGNNLFYNHGTVGIGTSNPNALYALDVIGDARISNNLYVGGGIVITDKVHAANEVKTISLKADTIVLDSNKRISGDAVFADKASFKGDVKLENKLEVTGNTKFNGTLTSAQGLMFDNVNGFRYAAANGSGPAKVLYGGTIFPTFGVPCAVQPNAGFNHLFGGIVQIYDVTNPATSGLLNLQTWTGGSSIDASIGGNTGGGGLLLNYFCGNNTFINTNNGLGNQGGIVYMGEQVSMAKSVKIGYDATSNINNNNALTIYQAGAGKKGVVLNTYDNVLPSFVVENPNFSYVPFTVFGDGRTRIGEKMNAGLLSVDGTIYAKEVKVTLNGWADYVFDSNYSLMALDKVERYIEKNHHLPNVPSAEEMVSNGNNLAETDKMLMRKIEELTLYVIELKKQNDKLTQEVSQLKK